MTPDWIKVYKAITDGPGPARVPDKPGSRLDTMLSHLVRKHGSQTKAAAALGVHRTTLQRWAYGQTKPKGRNLSAIQRAVSLPPRRRQLKLAREAELRGMPTIGLVAELQVSDDVRDRDVTFDGGAGWAGPLVDAYLTGGREELVVVLNDLLDAHYYPMQINSIDSVTIE